MKSTVLTLRRVSSATKQQLDKLALATRRSKSFLAAEAIGQYLATEAWQIDEIGQALQEADAGDFAGDEQPALIAAKYAR